MSETVEPLNLREQIARIDNLREEALKFAEESRKLTAEAAKLDRDRRLSGWFVTLALIGAAGGFVAGIQALLHLFGAIN